MARLWLLLIVFSAFIVCCSCEREGEGHQYEAAVPYGEDSYEASEEEFSGRGEEITMSMDEFKAKFGGGGEDSGSLEGRSDRHMLGMCWQSEMARCVNSCQEKSDEELLPSFLPLSFLLEKVKRVREELVEVCASYCQSDVSYSCTQLNLAYGGKRVFKFGGKWPTGRMWAFCELGAVVASTFAALVQILLLFRFRVVHSVLVTLLAELSTQRRSSAPLSESSSGESSVDSNERRARVRNSNAGATRASKNDQESGEIREEAEEREEEEENEEISYPYAWAWQLSHLVYLGAFVSLIVYHTVDTMLTEAIAFFTVGAAVLYRLYITVIFALSIRDFGLQVVTLTPLGGLLFFHCFRMLAIEFDYPFHRSMLTISVNVSGLLWIIWFILVRTRHAHVTAVIKSQACLIAAAIAWTYLDTPPFFDWTTDYHAVCYLLVSGVLVFDASFAIGDYRQFYRAQLVTKKKVA